MDSPIEEIKSRLDIVEVVGQYLKLRKTGANFSALCPFHSEKSGSFFVSPTRQTWRCFGCQKGGDMFTFIQEIESVEFGDALRILAGKAGVELKKPSLQDKEIKTERQRFYDACELAVRFYERQLQESRTGREAKKYLLDRGLSEESIASWRIGYSPDSWQGLHDFLASEGYDDSEIIGAGLAAASSGGRVYDRFRGRIMFPIFDFNSQAIGFGGRIFKNDKEGSASVQGYGEVKEAKYLNTTNTLLYDKSRVLYGLDRAKFEIRKLNACILVEGYTDVIMSAQAGVKNVAASSGTALTPFQLKILKRFTDNIILGYDMDLAGDTANRRGIDLALAEGFNVSVARPPYEGKDPADVIAIDPEEWKKAVANTQSIMEFHFDRAFAANDRATPLGRKSIAQALLPAIKTIPNAVEQAYWLQRIADRLEVRDIHYEEYLREELKKVKITEYISDNRNAAAIPARPREKRLEERILVLVIKFPKLAATIGGPAESFFSETARKIICGTRSGENYDGADLAGQEKNLFDALAIEAESETIDERAAAGEVEFQLGRVKDALFKQSLTKISRELLAAESRSDTAAAGRLREEFNLLSKSAAQNGPKAEK